MLCNSRQVPSVIVALTSLPIGYSVIVAHVKFINWARSDTVNTVQSFQRLGGFLHSESESTILAVQGQVLCTRVYQAKIMRCPVPSLMCRFCHDYLAPPGWL